MSPPNLILDLSNLTKTRMMRKVDLERAAASQLTRSADSFNLKSWLEILDLSVKRQNIA